MELPVIRCYLLTLHHHSLVGLDNIAEVSLRHLPSIHPETSSVESNLHILHLLHANLPLGQVLHVEVEGAGLQHDSTAGAAILVSPDRVKTQHSPRKRVARERDEVAAGRFTNEGVFKVFEFVEVFDTI